MEGVALSVILKSIKKLIVTSTLRLWNSPTFMTWGSFLSRSLTLILVLPLVLTRLQTGDIALWYLFSSIISLQTLMDAGFSPSFTRVIAFAMGGLEVKDLSNPSLNKDTKDGKIQANWQTIESICATMWMVYRRIALILLPTLLIFGTLALARGVSLSSNPTQAWLSWAVILITTILTLMGNAYKSYLQGINKIALLRRGEIAISMGAIVSSAITLLLGGGLLGLVIANQSWRVLNILLNRFLSRNAEDRKFKFFQAQTKDKNVWDAVWPSAWRTGLGVFMSYGLLQLSGIFYSQVGDAANISSYLLGLRLIQMISQFSRAPLYSKIPLLSQLHVTDKYHEKLKIMKKGMTLSYWVYVFMFIALGILGQPLLKYIGSNADFPDTRLWILMGLALFSQCYGAMHLQIYSITNHIIWHISNGISGIIYAALCVFLFPLFSVYAFPTSLLLSNLSFYCWYNAKHSYKEFGFKILPFESSTLLFPLSAILLYCLLALTFSVNWQNEFHLFSSTFT